MRISSVKELPDEERVEAPARKRTAPWRLIGLIIAFGVSAAIWLAIFWAIGYYA